MIHKLETDFEHIDERGQICQILSIPNKQVNYLFTKKGAKRGRHYHKEAKEYFYIISGKINVTASSVHDCQLKEEFIFESNDLFVIDPYSMHEFEFVEDTQMVVIYDLGVGTGNMKDIYTE